MSLSFSDVFVDILLYMGLGEANTNVVTVKHRKREGEAGSQFSRPPAGFPQGPPTPTLGAITAITARMILDVQHHF